ncbi:hypothetical protein ACFXA3_10565 [Streptomyces sp. NPDC059456]|uniref:hypothetical protein n=1 Tax=Streptomyces sp. NPDC059456 TaxID=3346838 RepID=UPI0036C37D60
MNHQDFSPRAAPSAVLRTPFQAPAVDRTPAAPARVDADSPGAEANWNVDWDRIGPRAMGIAPWYTRQY